MRRITFRHGPDEYPMTRAVNPAMALLLWYGSWAPPVLPPNPELFTVYEQPVGYPTSGQQFLELVVAACERQVGSGPPIDGRNYQNKCWRILKWMNAHGIINGLVVDQK